MKYNICWKCGNACANKCKYIRFGIAIDGWTAKKGKDNYLISKCPNFVTDGDVGVRKIGEILGVSCTTVSHYALEGKLDKLQAKAKEKGYVYRVYKDDGNTMVHILLPVGVQRGLDSNERL